MAWGDTSLTQTVGRILAVGSSEAASSQLREDLRDAVQLTNVGTLTEAAQLFSHCPEGFDLIVIAPEDAQAVRELHLLFRCTQVLDAVPDGIALLGDDLTVRWANAAFREQAQVADPVGLDFYGALGHPENLGPELCPLTRARTTGQRSQTLLQRSDSRYFLVTAVALQEAHSQTRAVVAVTRDMTSEILQRQKLQAVHQAGAELADLTPEDLAQMSVDQRIDLLKQQILKHTKDLLNLDAIEIRLLDRSTGRLEPLLCVGMDPEAACRPLFARPEGNGVTGYVAATGRSYLCEDTARDPLYLPGAPGAKSSITVPLILHDEVIGTLNVETPQPGRFTEDDVLFLELYARAVAKALRTLELLHAEKLTAASESVDLISREVALPVDAIIRDATWVLDRYIGHEPDLSERLRRILAAAREIKQLIQRIGEQIAPADAATISRLRPPRHPLLMGKRILLVDQDEAVRQAAHAVLERYGCIVETSADGAEAIAMARVSSYDAFICDIRLPDMNGYEMFRALREIQPHSAVVLMTGFGYDASHSIVRARREGLKAVLYKPFRIERLIAVMETVLSEKQPNTSNLEGPSSI
jgi:CheY-like chemotaxis protein